MSEVGDNPVMPEQDPVATPGQTPAATPVTPPLAAPNGDAAAPGPSWLEQDEVLRTMWLQNQTPQAISDALNRSVPAIMTRAARLGLPRRSAPGRKPGRRLLTETGGMADAVRQNRGDVQRRSVRTSTAPLNEPPVTSLRICLMCLHKFESAGRHNRICSSCKNSAEYETASSLSDIHLTSA